MMYFPVLHCEVHLKQIASGNNRLLFMFPRTGVEEEEEMGSQPLQEQQQQIPITNTSLEIGDSLSEKILLDSVKVFQPQDPIK
jgi:hypothetical protein